MGMAGTDVQAPTDDAVVARVLAGDPASFEVLMRRYNQRVFRAARSLLRDEAEAEDVVQDAWVRAYTHLGQFMGRASFATWVTRIPIHEAPARRRYRVRHQPLDEHADALPAPTRQPEQELGARQVAGAVELAIDALPARYRMAFVLRDLEGLSTAETAACLEVPAATVKTRLHRARSLLRRPLDTGLDVSPARAHAAGRHPDSARALPDAGVCGSGGPRRARVGGAGLARTEGRAPADGES